MAEITLQSNTAGLFLFFKNNEICRINSETFPQIMELSHSIYSCKEINDEIMLYSRQLTGLLFGQNDITGQLDLQENDFLIFRYPVEWDILPFELLRLENGWLSSRYQICRIIIQEENERAALEPIYLNCNKCAFIRGIAFTSENNREINDTTLLEMNSLLKIFFDKKPDNAFINGKETHKSYYSGTGNYSGLGMQNSETIQFNLQNDGDLLHICGHSNLENYFDCYDIENRIEGRLNLHEELRNTRYTFSFLSSCYSAKPVKSTFEKSPALILHEKSQTVIGYPVQVPAMRAKMITEELYKIWLDGRQSIGQTILILKRKMPEIIELQHLKQYGNPDIYFNKYSIIEQELLIRHLTARFTGRQSTIKNIFKTLFEMESGIMSISGHPGIGKSAIAAEMVRVKYHLSDFEGISQEDLKSLIIIPYFIRKGEIYSTAQAFIKVCLMYIKKLFNRNDFLLNDINMIYDDFSRFIENIASGLPEGSKIVFLIDGLDEADESLLKILPVINVKGLIFLFFSRPIPEVVERLEQFIIKGFEYHTVEITPFTESETIEYLSGNLPDNLNFDEIKADIYSKTQGLPLYLYLLMNDIYRTEQYQSILSEVPLGIEKLFKHILKRNILNTNRHENLKALLTLSLVKEDVTARQVLEMGDLHLNEDDIRGLFTGLSDIVALTNSKTHAVCYNYFHHSIREYLYHTYPDLMVQQYVNILQYCRKWKNHKDPYCFTHYISHLYDGCYSDEQIINLKLSKELYKVAASRKFQRNHSRVLGFDSLILNLEDSLKVLDVAIADDSIKNLDKYIEPFMYLFPK